MALDKQINVLSVDTGNFYSNTEAALHKKNHKLRNERNQLVTGYSIVKPNGEKRIIVGLKEIENKLDEYGITKEDLNLISEQAYDFSKFESNSDMIIELTNSYFNTKKLIAIKNKAIKETKDKLLQLLENKVNANIETNGKHNVRELRFFNKNNEIPLNNIISVFDSSFTRMIGAKQDELCEDFMVVQVYYFSIIKDLIYHGFKYKGEKYVYFTSSAGQIRTKKTVFVKESVWKKYEKTIMCGLTIDDINKKGGNNPN
jgi:hypothetical protein